MKYKDSIKWLESLKQQIGQAQHSDLWHFEQAIDETIDNLRPLAEPHGRLIDADKLIKFIQDGINREHDSFGYDGVEILTEVQFSQTIIEAEVSE